MFHVVIGRIKGDDGKAFGTFLPIRFSIPLSMMLSIKLYATANTIAQNMFSQVDTDGHQSQLLEAIIDYAKERCCCF